MVNVSEGMTLTINMFQMKVFNAIAAAAVIGTSFIAANPAEARNGWVYVGKGEREGTTHYIKYRGHEGPNARFEWRTANTSSPWQNSVLADCNSWSYKEVGSNDWSDALPETMADAALEEVCSYKPIAIAPARRKPVRINQPPQNRTTPSINSVDSAVVLVHNVVKHMSNGDSYSARSKMTGAALNNYDPSFFNQFNRVSVSNLKVTNQAGSHYDLLGKMTYVYKDGSLQTEERTFSVATANTNPKLTATEFVKVIKSRH